MMIFDQTANIQIFTPQINPYKAVGYQIRVQIAFLHYLGKGATVHIDIARLIENKANTIELNQLSYSPMFRLVLQSPFFADVKQSANLSKYVIKRNAYLIEAPPKRPTSAYAIYLTEKTKGLKGLLIPRAKNIGMEWKLMKENQDKYNQLAKENSAGYAEKKKQYQQKYLEPFKITSIGSQRVKKLFEDGVIKTKKGQRIKGIGQQVRAELAKPKNLEDEKKIEEKVAALKAERDAKKKAFLFPTLPPRTLRGYKICHSLPKDQRGATHEADMKAGYAQEKKAWRVAMKKWLEDNKYDLTVEGFQALLKKEERRKKREAKPKEEESDQ